MTSDHYTLLSWVRDGAAALLTQQENLSESLPARGSLPVLLEVASLPSGRIDSVDVSLTVYGPGDVKALDRDEIVRVEPPDGAADFEPDFTPCIEFRRPDLPWLFSPVAGTAANRQKLRPWLCLVVVPEDVATLQPGIAGNAPILTCPVMELPDPADSWAWAHAQIVNLQSNESIATVLKDHPGRALSRLLCPRRLEAGRRYHACLVPTFKAGVEAGLGEPVHTDTLEPAWRRPSNGNGDNSISLPVYHHWRFSTGEAGNFEALVRRLQPYQIGRGTAARGLDVSEPGAGVILRQPGDPAEVLTLAGALAGTGHTDEPWNTPAGQRFNAELRQKFDQAADASARVVGPPLYGRWYAGLNRPPGPNEGPHWLRDLNLDPRLRVYASLGAQTVQKHQEALMASAWEQFDEVEAANQALRQAQLARDVGKCVLGRRVRKFSPETLVQVTRGAHARVNFQGEPVSATVSQSETPDGIVSSGLRRMIRPKGPLIRRSARYKAIDPRAFVRQTAGGTVTIDTRAIAATGLIVLDDTSAANTFGLLTSTLTAAKLRAQKDKYKSQGFSTWTAKAPRRTVGTITILEITLDDIIKFDRAFNSAIAVMERQERLGRTPLPNPTGFLNVDAMAAEVTAQLDPEQTVVDSVRARFESEVVSAGDPLEPILAAPYFPQPMGEVLQEMAPDFLLAGSAGLPAESVSLVQTHSAFVHAYMIGLNHEMASELLWRGYPTDQRGTYFRRFWDRAGFDHPSPGQPRDEYGPVDIDELHRLPSSLRLLGSNSGSANHFVSLVIRGSLIRRFPNLSLYANPAQFNGTRRRLAASGARDPMFSGRLGADTAFFGFDLTEAQVRGGANDPGWFFVFREPPTDLRFGLDSPAASAGVVPPSIDGLAWNHVMDATKGDTHANLLNSRATPSTTFAEVANPTTGAKVTWAANGAHMARCFLQWPVSVAFHAETLLPPAAQAAS